jgi:hypothetical protein
VKKRKPMKRVILITLPVPATVTGLSIAGLCIAVGLFTGSPGTLPGRFLSLLIACAAFGVVIAGKRQLRRQRYQFTELLHSQGGEDLPEQNLSPMPDSPMAQVANDGARSLSLVQDNSGPAEILSLNRK